MSKLFRPSIVAVFVNQQGLVLLGERYKNPGNWQFPQGGIDPGETPEQALYREIKEELGTDEFSIIKTVKKKTSYCFPADLDSSIAEKYKGQKCCWFQTAFRNGVEPDLSLAKDKEFRSLRWAPLPEAIDGIIDWKREACMEGLRLLGLLS